MSRAANAPNPITLDTASYPAVWCPAARLRRLSR
jgi:hypothetical protein